MFLLYGTRRLQIEVQSNIGVMIRGRINSKGERSKVTVGKMLQTRGGAFMQSAGLIKWIKNMHDMEFPHCEYEK